MSLENIKIVKKFRSDASWKIVFPFEIKEKYVIVDSTDGKIIVRPTNLEKAIKEYTKRVEEVLKRVYKNIELDENTIIENLKDKEFFTSLEIMRFLRNVVIEYLQTKYNIPKTDLDFILKNASL